MVQDGRKYGEDQRACESARNSIEGFGCSDCKWSSAICFTGEFVVRGGEGESESGPVVEALVKGRAGDHSEESAEAVESTGVAGRVFSGIENFVGMDQI